MNDFDLIKKNLDAIYERIEKAANRAGKKPEEIVLVAVSKKVSIERVKLAFDCGVKNFGENYIQEGIEKALNLKANWHFIGHLQSNKAKIAAENFTMIQSVDSVSLAEKLNSYNKQIDVLLQIHYGDEESKHGFLPEEISEVFEKINMLKNLRVKGFMTIPPFVENPEDNRFYFEDMRLLSEKIFKNEIPILSMGMTDDFETAIEEGSNMIRVGRAIFGSR